MKNREKILCYCQKIKEKRCYNGIKGDSVCSRGWQLVVDGNGDFYG